jgi:hypothetical protein
VPNATISNIEFARRLTQTPYNYGFKTKRPRNFFAPEPLRKLTRSFTASALESPLLFSFHAPVVPGRAEVQLALHPLAAQQVDPGHLARSLWLYALLADQPDQPLLARPALAAWSALVH